MARRKKADSGGPGTGDWLNTYADMVTLLLTFFILLFSMSSMDAAKFNMLVAAFASQMGEADTLVIIGTAEGSPNGIEKGSTTLDDISEEDLMQAIYEQLQAFVAEQGIGESVEVSQGEGYVFISFSDNMLFEPNSARLKPADLEILNFVGYGIKSIQDSAEMIMISGHTAAIPDDPKYPVSDRLLSAERANAVLMHFEDSIQIDSEKLMLAAFGKQRPIGGQESNNTDQGRARNRRVEILISAENSIADQMDIVYERLGEA